MKQLCDLTASDDPHPQALHRLPLAELTVMARAGVRADDPDSGAVRRDGGRLRTEADRPADSTGRGIDAAASVPGCAAPLVAAPMSAALPSIGNSATKKTMNGQCHRYQLYE